VKLRSVETLEWPTLEGDEPEGTMKPDGRPDCQKRNRDYGFEATREMVDQTGIEPVTS